MPTSGTSALELTFADAAKSAAVELGAIGASDELEDSEREEMQRRANSMLKTWSVEANLFREASATVTIPGGAGAVSLPAEVRDVGNVSHIVSATQNRQLFQWNRSQWKSLPNPAAVGTPTVFYYQQGTGDVADQLYVWPVPATDIDLALDYSRGAYVVDAPDETMDLPTEWHEAFILGLASRCASMFGTTRIDPNTVARVDASAGAIYQRMLDADRPDSYEFYGDGYGCNYA